MLSLKQIKDVCLVDDVTHRRCRYLSQDDNDRNKFYCMKISAKAEKIDEEIDSYVHSMHMKGKNIHADNLPLGDNCGGYPLLRHIEQGYDQKN